MKTLIMKDVEKLDEKGIEAKVSELRGEIFQIRMQKSAAGIEKPHQIKIAKKNIARLLTAKNAKGKSND